MKKTSKLLSALALSGVMSLLMFGCAPQEPNPNPNPDPDPGPTIERETRDEYDGELEAKIGVGGYEWGPAVDMLMFKVNGQVSADSLSAEMFSASTGANRALNVLDAYPCTEDGIETNDNSEYFAVKFAAQYNLLSPFSFEFRTMANSWSDGDITISLSMNDNYTLDVISGNKIISYSEFSFDDPISVADRVVPSTANMVRGSYSGENYADPNNPESDTTYDFTLTYAAYETEEMKNDGVKNPLIIWLHGVSEGGTDTDLALLGNDVTNVTEKTIQNHFIKDDVKGAYVLVVQTPTLWLDRDGTGYPGPGFIANGDAISVYTEVLMDTIEHYVAENGDIDENRIYIGGCSNGGYMTVNMMIQYGDYFAAAYPICEGYSDAFITDEQLAALAGRNMWFVVCANDSTVENTLPTYTRLIGADAENVHLSYFESIHGTDDPTQTYVDHWVWIYLFHDQCTGAQVHSSNRDDLVANNPAGGGQYVVSIDGEATTLWGWLAAQVKGEHHGSIALDPDAPDPEIQPDVPPEDATRLEAETYGVVGGEANPEGNYIGDGYLQGLTVQGLTVTFTFTASAAGTAEIVFNMASTNYNQDFTIADSTANASLFTVSVNNENVDYTEQTIVGGGNFMQQVFTRITMGTVNIVEGPNTVVLTITYEGMGFGAPNLDYMDVLPGGNISITPVAPV